MNRNSDAPSFRESALGENKFVDPKSRNSGNGLMEDSSDIPELNY